jgi:hypothetical protein
MSNRQTRRRYRKSKGRRVWVFSELNHDLRPEQIAKIITTAGLERARLEAAAQADDATRQAGSSGEEAGRA